MIDRGVEDRRRLLVVADDVASAEALRVHLSRHGFAVARATSPRAAARAARELAPDVVLVDAAIKGGWRDVVLALDGLVDRSRVAVLAAYWSADARVAAREFGIGETLLKQLEGPVLVRRLERLAAPAPDIAEDHGGGPEPSTRAGTVRVMDELPEVRGRRSAKRRSGRRGGGETEGRGNDAELAVGRPAERRSDAPRTGPPEPRG